MVEDAPPGSMRSGPAAQDLVRRVEEAALRQAAPLAVRIGRPVAAVDEAAPRARVSFVPPDAGAVVVPIAAVGDRRAVQALEPFHLQRMQPLAVDDDVAPLRTRRRREREQQGCGAEA